MRVHSVRAENFRPFAMLEEVRLGSLATIVGQNDAGKSNILRALRVFFEDKPKIDERDVHDGAGPGDSIVIEVAFTDLPNTIKLPDGIETALGKEHLLDVHGHLRIRKNFPRTNLTKPEIVIIVQDFSEDLYAGLATLKETELNRHCAATGLDVSRAGRGITNKGKRDALRDKARSSGIALIERELPVSANDDLWKTLASVMPEFELFECDTRLGVGETSFQGQFRAIVKTAAESPGVTTEKDAFMIAISNGLQGEVDKIFNKLQQHTDAFTGLSVKPEFSWDKAVTFELLGKDHHGVQNSLEQRGSGMRRLLMVAFFQYLAERNHEAGRSFVFAVEEPENCLHPRLQRELVSSFVKLAERGYQVITTSHSPVVAGASPIDDLALVVRTAGVARAIQTPELNPSTVADELGIEPSDLITGYRACIFVEGPNDITFWKSVAFRLKEAGHLNTDFDMEQIGFVITGGDNLKHWVSQRAMCRINRRFAVIVDSDRTAHGRAVPGRKLNWKVKCEADGGMFFITRKRAIENYLHPDAIVRSNRPMRTYDDFTDMKSAFGENVVKVIEDMSCEEILRMDCYEENGIEHHELKEIVDVLLNLPRL